MGGKIIAFPDLDSGTDWVDVVCHLLLDEHSWPLGGMTPGAWPVFKSCKAAQLNNFHLGGYLVTPGFARHRPIPMRLTVFFRAEISGYVDANGR